MAYIRAEVGKTFQVCVVSVCTASVCKCHGRQTLRWSPQFLAPGGHGLNSLVPMSVGRTCDMVLTNRLWPQGRDLEDVL